MSEPEYPVPAEPLVHRVGGAPPSRRAPLLLLNGGMMTMMTWDEIAAPLERELQVVRCDFRGQLMNPAPPPKDLDGHVADVVGLLDHLGIARAHLLGTSYGALVATRLAARHPDRVASLVLVTSTDQVTDAMAPAGAALYDAARAAADGSGDPGRVLDVLLETAYSPAYLEPRRELWRVRRATMATLPRRYFEGLVGLLGALVGLDLRPDLPAIHAPTLVVGAGRDATFPPAHSRALAAGIAGARLVIVESSGHALVVEQPGALLEAVLAFWRELGVLAPEPVA